MITVMKMNWILAILGVPVGMLLFEVGWRLKQKLKPESASIEGLLLALPFSVFCVGIVLADIFFGTYLLDIAAGLFAFSVTSVIFAIVLGMV